jgi:hypothetical protein
LNLQRCVSTPDFTRDKFVYDGDNNCYICPLGKVLPYRSSKMKDGVRIYLYKCRDYGACPCREKCTIAKKGGRSIRRSEDEYFLIFLKERTEANPELIKMRKQLCEHPFGTIKRGLGFGHFLTRGLEKTGAEMGLTCLMVDQF